MSDRQAVESHGTPRIDAQPVDFPCLGPGCDKYVRSHLTDEDVAAHETIQVLRYTPESDDERLVRYWFCSPGCHNAFAEAVESGDREETIYNDG